MEGWSLRSLTKMVSNVKQMVTGEHTELEWKLRELTNSDPWGCSPTDMQAFIDELRQADEREEVLKALQRRLTEGGSWRNRYKSLNVLDHVIKHGPLAFVELIREDQTAWLDILDDLKEGYEYVDEKGKDEGINVRVKAKNIMELLNDPELLENTRAEEQEKRSLMQKRRQEFKQYGNSNSSYDSISKSPTPAQAPGAYSELAQASPSLVNNVEKQNTDLLGDNATPMASQIAVEKEDDFDDFQSAPTSASTPADPFEDLLKL